MLRRFGFWLLLAILVTLAIRFEFKPAERIAGGEPKVIDGDSFRLGGREIRIAGIDAPEYRQACRDAANAEWPCGREARQALESLLAEEGLACTTEAEDRYGRALSHCRTDRGDVGREMVRQGWALGARDRRFAEHPREMEEARRAGRGIWRGSHQHPADWRKQNAREGPLAP